MRKTRRLRTVNCDNCRYYFGVIKGKRYCGLMLVHTEKDGVEREIVINREKVECDDHNRHGKCVHFSRIWWKFWIR